MKYANEIIDIINAFKTDALSGSELDGFYKGTMEFRTGDKFISPIRDIYDACRMPSEQNAILLMGHRGCGKSTELNYMSSKLSDEGYHIKTVHCMKDADLINLYYTDLLILMGDALLQIVDEIDCELDQQSKEKIISFWTEEVNEIKTTSDSSELSAGAELRAESPGFLSSILKININTKANLRYNQEKRTEYRKKISHRSSEWLLLLNQISDKVTKKLNGKQPIIIFEDLDKMDPLPAWEIFNNFAATLTGPSFPIIYTFPIASAYYSQFASLSGYYNLKTLPMIQIETIKGEIYREGIDVIVEIIKKRAKLDIFEESVLDKLIKNTGGSLRNLFYAINTSAQRAIRRENTTMSIEDAESALNELKTSLTRRIERKHYDFLSNIYNGNRTLIEDREMLLELINGSAVLEYGNRWYNVHPLVAAFLVKHGLTKNKE
jgi:hypothetical protein